jgi:hypothetical protein
MFLLRQKLVSAAAKPLGSVSPLSRWVFSAQDGSRQNRLEISFLNLFLKILYVVCSLNGNGNFWRIMKLSFTWRR